MYKLVIVFQGFFVFKIIENSVKWNYENGYEYILSGEIDKKNVYVIFMEFGCGQEYYISENIFSQDYYIQNFE